MNSNDSNTLPLLWRSPELEGPVRAIAWSPDGEKLAIAGFFGIKVFKIVEESERKLVIEKIIELDPHLGTTNSIAWSPNGRYLAISSTNAKLAIVDLEHRRVVYVDKASGVKVSGIVTASICWNGDLIASAGENFIALYRFKHEGVEKLWEISSDHLRDKHGITYLRIHRVVIHNTVVYAVGYCQRMKAMDRYIAELSYEVLLIRAHMDGTYRVFTDEDLGIRESGYSGSLTTNCVSIHDDRIALGIQYGASNRIIVLILPKKESPAVVAESKVSDVPASVAWLDSKTIAVGLIRGLMEFYRIEDSRIERIASYKTGFSYITCVSYNPKYGLIAIAGRDNSEKDFIYIYSAQPIVKTRRVRIEMVRSAEIEKTVTDKSIVTGEISYFNSVKELVPEHAGAAAGIPTNTLGELDRSLNRYGSNQLS